MLFPRLIHALTPPLVTAAPLVDPTVVFNGAGSVADPSTFTTTADIEAGDALVLFIWANRFLVSVSGAGATWTVGTSQTTNDILSNATAIAGAATPAGSTISLDLSGAPAGVRPILLKLPSGGAKDIDGTGAGATFNTAPAVTIAARNSAPQYVVVGVGCVSNASTIGTPADWTKAATNGTAAGMSVFWRRVTDAASLGFSTTITATNWACDYVTLESD